VTIPDERRTALRGLPSVDDLARRLREAAPGVGEAAAVSIARTVTDERRRELLGGADPADGADLLPRARERLASGLPRVINATGVVLHTNLGRAPLAAPAVDAVGEAARGYVALELDLGSGRRGPRGAAVAALLCELTGAAGALVVNNGAAATLLAVSALAGPGGAVIVSRGQLVEIGGGFRIPEVVEQSGARLVEVGTTNRTRLSDYRDALERVAGPAVILRVHQSNFRTVGFVADVGVAELARLGAPVIDDIGSGVLHDHDGALGDEPLVPASVAAGVAVTCFSGDKLLGGPLAGLMVGLGDAIEACRRHPLARAVRADRLALAALQATLHLHRDPARAAREIPTLAMLLVDDDVLRRRAAALAAATGGSCVEVVGRVGGGALPLRELRGPAVALPAVACGADALARALRCGTPAVVARIVEGRVVLDPRAVVDDGEVAELGRAAAAAIARVAGAG